MLLWVSYSSSRICTSIFVFRQASQALLRVGADIGYQASFDSAEAKGPQDPGDHRDDIVKQLSMMCRGTVVSALRLEIVAEMIGSQRSGGGLDLVRRWQRVERVLPTAAVDACLPPHVCKAAGAMQ